MGFAGSGLGLSEGGREPGSDVTRAVGGSAAVSCW